MSGKRSDRLRSMIAATVMDAAENAAPVGVTGASFPAPVSADSRVKTPDEMAEELISSKTAHPEPSSATAVQAVEPLAPLPVAPAPSTAPIPGIAESRAPLRAPERAAKAPKWEKANVTLQPRDLAILERFDAQARAYGFRIRKGGNPSLFVRAGLRFLDELSDQDPEGWINRIAAMTSSGSESPE